MGQLSSRLEESPSLRSGTMRRNSCFPLTTINKETYHQASTVSMMSVTVPSASIFVPRVKRRETFSKADMKSSYSRRASLQSTRAASESVIQERPANGTEKALVEILFPADPSPPPGENQPVVARVKRASVPLGSPVPPGLDVNVPSAPTVPTAPADPAKKEKRSFAPQEEQYVPRHRRPLTYEPPSHEIRI